LFESPEGKAAGLMLLKFYPSSVRRPSCYSPKETMKLIDGIPIWGTPDEGAVRQIKTCAKTADTVALMADHHNHCVDLFTDEQDRVWIGVHFGSRVGGFQTEDESSG
jgi:hypothetical protein